MATTSPSQRPPPLRTLVDTLTAARPNMRLATITPMHAPSDLRGHVDAGLGGAHTAEEPVGQRDHGVEVRARHGSEGEDEGHERGTGGDCVDQQLQTDVAGQARGHDP